MTETPDTDDEHSTQPTAAKEGLSVSFDSFTISASEKVSTGEYENHDVFIEVDGTIEGVNPTVPVSEDLADAVGEAMADRVEEILLHAARGVSHAAQTTAENRIKLADSETWEPRRPDHER